MARIKMNINEDSTLVKFDCVRMGEIFVKDGIAYIKIFPLKVGESINCFRLNDGACAYYSDDTLVTYVKSAELKLTIADAYDPPCGLWKSKESKGE